MELSLAQFSLCLEPDHFTQTLLDSKKNLLDPKLFWTQSFLYLNFSNLNFYDQNFLGPNIFFSTQIFLGSNTFRPKVFWTLIVFGSKVFGHNFSF